MEKQYLIETSFNSSKEIYVVSATNSYEAVIRYIKKEYQHTNIGKILCKAENLTTDELISLLNSAMRPEIHLVAQLSDIGMIYSDVTATIISEDK